jgi:putative spermidine/putrescine transport system permease protein
MLGARGAARADLATALLLLPALLFLAVWFVAPLAQLFQLSVTGTEGPFAPYAQLLGSEVYRRVFVNTLWLALTVTAISVLLAYPTAYVLARLKGWRLTLAFYCVLFPFWISVLIRTFAWMLLLEKNGPINRLLIGLGAIDRPLDLLFNMGSVHVGMVHVLLPYAVLPIYAAMARIDGRLLLASDGLGASPPMTFLRVYLPLTMPGVAAAAVFVFLLALGFFITPALLGGVNAITVAMLIEQLVNERLVWPLAGAASFILLAVILALLALAARVVPLGQALVAR